MAPGNANLGCKPGSWATPSTVPSCVNPGKAQTLFVLPPITPQNTTALACFKAPCLMPLFVWGKPGCRCGFPFPLYSTQRLPPSPVLETTYRPSLLTSLTQPERGGASHQALCPLTGLLDSYPIDLTSSQSHPSNTQLSSAHRLEIVLAAPLAFTEYPSSIIHKFTLPHPVCPQ